MTEDLIHKPSGPCDNCPYTIGNMGSYSEREAEAWELIAHGDDPIRCLKDLNSHCYGSAIYRKNISKSPRNQLAWRSDLFDARVFPSAESMFAYYGKGKKEDDWKPLGRAANTAFYEAVARLILVVDDGDVPSEAFRREVRAVKRAMADL